MKDALRKATAPTTFTFTSTSTTIEIEIEIATNENDDRETQATVFDDVPPPDQDDETGSIFRTGGKPNRSTSITAGNNHFEKDLDLQRRLEDFKHACHQRLVRGSWLSYYGYGYIPPLVDFQLVRQLDTLRADIDWTRDAERRRKAHEHVLSWSDHEKARLARGRTTPVFTWTVFWICTALAVVSSGLDDWKLHSHSRSNVLLQAGVLSTDAIVKHGEWYRLVTSVLLHSGFGHWCGNMLGLLLWGPPLERIYGSIKIAVVVLAASIGGGLVTALNNAHQSTSLGASGGVIALIGMGFALVIANWGLLTRKEENESSLPKKGTVIICVLTTELIAILITGFAPGTNQFAHLGGLGFGFFFAAPFAVQVDRFGIIGVGSNWSIWWRLLCFAIGFFALEWAYIALERRCRTDSLPAVHDHAQLL